MFAVLSDVHLDSPAVLASLRSLLDGFARSGSIPALFLLMGNFLSAPFGASPGDAARFREGAAALAALLADFPDVAAAAHFVLVPGPGDPGAAPVLPRPPLPAALCAPLLGAGARARVTLATNPCRLRFFSQEVTVFRAEVTTRLVRASALPPAVPRAPDAPPGAPAEPPPAPQPLAAHVAATLVAQGHALPLPLASQPVYWEYDHALRLSPTPDALIVGEDQLFWAADANGAVVFCPGSFAADASFAVYRPAARSVEESAVREEGAEEDGTGGEEA